MHNPFENTELSKDDIKALRKADRFIIEWARNPASAEPAPASLTCIRTAKEPLERDLEYVIRARCTTRAATAYWRRDAQPERVRYAYAMLYQYPEQACPVSSALALLRAGDRVSLRIDANNQSQSVDEAGIAVDTITLAIERKAGKGYKRLSFVLQDFAVPRDSSMRICRVEPQ
jgi:hypothetical protein